MANLILLLLLELIVIILNLKIFKGDIFSISSLSSICILVSTLFALYCADIWDLYISGNTVVVIVFGLFAMTFGETFGKKIKVRKGNHSTNTNSMLLEDGHVTNRLDYLQFGICKKTILMIITIFFTLAYGINAYSVGMMNGGTSLNAFAYMKQAYLNSGRTLMNPFIRQGFKIVMASAYISAFVIANNLLVLKGRLTDNIHYIVCILCGVIITIFSSSRTEMIRIIVAVVIDYLILWKMQNGRTRRFNKKLFILIVKKFAPVLLIAVLIAFASRAVVKTGGGVSGVTSVLYYLAYYVGSPIAVLNTKIDMAFSHDTLLLCSNAYVPEFVYLGKLDYGGNVATIFWRSLYETGIIGMFFYIFLVYSIGGYIYKIVSSYKKNSLKKNIGIIMFAYIYYVYAMSYYGDILISNALQTNVFTAVVLLLVYKAFTKIRFGRTQLSNRLKAI